MKSREKQVRVPFSAVTGFIEKLEPRDSLFLREWLDERLAEYEDTLILDNPRMMHEIRGALSEYMTGAVVPVNDLRGRKSQSRKAHV